MREWQDALGRTADADRQMELRRELLSAEMVDPGTGELIKTPVEVRFDPLTGHTPGSCPSGD